MQKELQLMEMIIINMAGESFIFYEMSIREKSGAHGRQTIEEYKEVAKMVPRWNPREGRERAR